MIEGYLIFNLKLEVLIMLGYIAIFIGGGIGSILRYALTIFANKFFGYSYPYGTFIVNILGCLFIGFVLALTINKSSWLNFELRLFLATGIAGGFTTFSSFSYEALTLIKKGQISSSISYIILSPVLGLLAVYLGTYLAKFYKS